MSDPNPWWPPGTRLGDMMADAVAAIDTIRYTGPMPEQHVCDFGEIVATKPTTVYRCTVRWSDGVQCSHHTHDQSTYATNCCYMPPERPDAS